jgi:hypothetical protein
MGRAQVTAPPVQQAVPAAVPSALPEPIYWKQDLFLIPYQWGSPADPASAQAVWLFVSKDRGASWQKISEANPQVRAFNYRADGEGEYWFAIHTLDRQGRQWPGGPHRPELRVIVDTTIPRFEELRGLILPNGQIDVFWRCSDINLDANSVLIEAQVDATGTWQSVPLATAATASPGVVTPSALGITNSGHVSWQPPAGARPSAIRATVLDRAKNAASYRAELELMAGPLMTSPSTVTGTAPTSNGPAAASATNALPVQLPSPATSGWTSAGNAPAVNASPANQTWPAVPGRTPFRLSNTATTTRTDGVTAYGSPRVSTAPAITPATTPPLDNGAYKTNPRAADVGPLSARLPQAAEGGFEQAPANGPRFAALDPFRPTSSYKRLPSPATAENPVPSSTTVPNLTQSLPAVGPIDATAIPAAQTKQVGSRTFALEYDLDATGRWGVSKVELWGTRDHGKSWHRFAIDDDHRSPLVVTVDEPGLYGFRIVVDVAGSAASPPPSSGEEPELWVSVDLNRPAIELTAIERGDGNLADHLTFQWKVADDNLETRPIALFYSSRPTGPWSAIATNLENTGEYTWRVERFVPARFYVRVEARDFAGNLAAFQTREPIDFAPLAASGHLRAAEPIGSTAAGPEGAFRE